MLLYYVCILLCTFNSCYVVVIHNTPLFFFNDTATTEIYTLSLHDALPICSGKGSTIARPMVNKSWCSRLNVHHRSEEHTSELQSRFDLVCRLLLEKKKNKTQPILTTKQYNPPHSQLEHSLVFTPSILLRLA